MTRSLSSRFRANVCTQLTVLSLALGMVSLSGIDPAFAQEQRLRTLTVTGMGMVEIPTTLAEVRLGVEVQKPTAQEAQQEAARRSSAVVDLLRSRNVEKLQTTGISLNPIYSYDNNTQRLTGYVAMNIVSFRLKNDAAGSLLDEAVNAGATRIDGISFVATDEAIAQAQQSALREAIQDAQTQGDVVLAALNLTRREVVNIQINNASAPTPPPIFANYERSAMADAASTPVIGGEQEVRAFVTLQISY